MKKTIKKLIKKGCLTDYIREIKNELRGWEESSKKKHYPRIGKSFSKKAIKVVAGVKRKEDNKNEGGEDQKGKLQYIASITVDFPRRVTLPKGPSKEWLLS